MAREDPGGRAEPVRGDGRVEGRPSGLGVGADPVEGDVTDREEGRRAHAIVKPPETESVWPVT